MTSDHQTDPVPDTPLEPGKLPELAPQDPGKKPWVNNNAYMNRLGAAQGITFGDWNGWYLGGYAPASGSTGQAACDGCIPGSPNHIK